MSISITRGLDLTHYVLNSDEPRSLYDLFAVTNYSNDLGMDHCNLLRYILTNYKPHPPQVLHLLRTKTLVNGIVLIIAMFLKSWILIRYV